MPIDISLLRELLRNELEIEELLNFLDRAIELLPEERLPELIEGFFDPDLLKVEELSEQSLLEDFEVNSKNFMEKSRGTINWIAQYNRLMKRCQKESSKGKPEKSLTILAGLHYWSHGRRILVMGGESSR